MCRLQIRRALGMDPLPRHWLTREAARMTARSSHRARPLRPTKAVVIPIAVTSQADRAIQNAVAATAAGSPTSIAAPMRNVDAANMPNGKTRDQYWGSYRIGTCCTPCRQMPIASRRGIHHVANPLKGAIIQIQPPDLGRPQSGSDPGRSENPSEASVLAGPSGPSGRANPEHPSLNSREPSPGL